MSKWDKGLHQDNKPVNQPQGTYPYGKNGIVFENLGSIQNEPGFRKIVEAAPGPVVGVVETDSKPVFLIVLGGALKIYYFDPEAETFSLQLDTATLANSPVFDPNNYFTGEAQRNYKGELVILITNKTQPPLYINCDVPGVTDFTQLYQFPSFSIPTVVTTMEGGGGLPDGSYFLFTAYGRQDGAKTQFISAGIPIRIGVDTQGRSIKVELSNLDQNYDEVILGVLVRGTEDKVFELEPVPFGAGNLTIFYTGSETTTTITREELLVAPPNYSKVGTVGQLNDALYEGDLEVEPEFDWQPYANMLKLDWVTRPVGAIGTPDELMSTGQELGFMHQEVYAFYARLNMTNGRQSKAFHIPGPDIPGADAVITMDGITDKKFRLDDTCPSANALTRTGEMGVWINESETYPDVPSFDSSAIGGLNLRGQKVRHHRFPSLHFIRAYVYPGNPEYGKTELDILGIQVKNVIIPAQLQGRVASIEILFAKRSVSNSTIVGQSMYLAASKKANESVNNPTNGYTSTGGNWESIGGHPTWATTERLKPELKFFRTHAFDMLFYKPKTDLYFIHPQYRLRKSNIRQEGWIEDGSVPPGSVNGPIVEIVDYTRGSAANHLPAAGKRWKVKKSKYLPNNAWVEDLNNSNLEGVFAGELDVPANYDFSLSIPQSFPKRDIHSDVNKMADYEETYLVNLVGSRTNLYSSLFSQQLVSTNRRIPLGQTPDIYGGDTYVVDYSFHTYGLTDWRREGHFPSDDKAKGGYRIARRIVLESSANLYLRYEEAGNIYSKWYPRSPLVGQDPSNYLTAFRSDNEPNQFGYKREFSLLNDLIGSVINNPARPPLTKFPYRIHRTGKVSRQSKYRSWRNILPLDYYEMQKNMGKIVNLEGQDDQLLIHMENALFITRDKTVLQGENDLITLGSGDIFRFEPQEAVGSKLGFAGTIHELAAVKTPAGYVFVDAPAGEVFLFKGKLQMLNQGLMQFLRQYLKIKDKNPFIGNGITIGYDRKFKRLLMTVKNREVEGDVVVVNLEDDLVIDQSVIQKFGKLLLYKGVNDTLFECPGGPIIPTVNDFVITIPENTPLGTHLLTLPGVNVQNFYLLNGTGTFQLDAATGKLYLISPLDYESTTQYLLNVKGVSSTGDEDTAIITVNITDINEPPIVPNYEFTIPENIPIGDPAGQVTGDDPEGMPLTYTIVSGNEEGKFAINSATGIITVIGALNFENAASYTLGVSVSDGTNTVTSIVEIIVANVSEPIEPPDFTISIPDTTPDDTDIFDPAEHDEFNDVDGDTYEYSIISQSVPGVFAIDPTTGKLRLLYNSSLDARTTPSYVVQIQAIESSTGTPVSFQITVLVTFDRKTITWQPFNDACDSSCNPGYTLSGDGTFCYKDEEMPATPPSGGEGSPDYIADNRQHASYGEFGARLFSTYNLDGRATGPVIYLTGSPWQGTPTRVNQIGIWATLNCGSNVWEPIANSYIGFARTFNLATTKTYYLAVAGDNKIRIKLDGNQVLEQLSGTGELENLYNFKYLNIYPLTIPAGTHIIEIEGNDDGFTSAMFGCEIYDNTAGEIISANNISELNIVFTTADEFCQDFDLGDLVGWSCPVGWALDSTPIPPVCRRTLTEPPIAGSSVKRWANVRAVSSKYGGDIVATFDNEPGQTWNGLTVPYYPAIPNHIDCGGAVETFLSVLKTGTAQKNDCPEGSGSIEEYVVPAGFFMSTVDQADADALAQAEIDANKQTYANTVGTCQS